MYPLKTDHDDLEPDCITNLFSNVSCLSCMVNMFSCLLIPLRCVVFLNLLLDFGLSYAKNGELLKYIRKIGSFDETCTRFYSAEIVCALEYLHEKGIIHR